MKILAGICLWNSNGELCCNKTVFKHTTQTKLDIKRVQANISRSRYNTPQYAGNGTAHAAGASILSPAMGVFAGMRNVHVRHACSVRWAWRITAGLCHTFP